MAAGETVIASGDPLAHTIFSVALEAETEKATVFIQQMAGPISKEDKAVMKVEKRQTTPDMPIVIINDLTDAAGDEVTVDMFHRVSGKPFMGDREMEGRGVGITFDTDKVKIDQTRFPIKPGGRMTRKRTSHNLRKIARGNMASYFARLNDELIQVHMAGARGDENTTDWNVPLETDEDFASILINPLLPPTTNRYFVAGGNTDVAGIANTDPLKLEDLDVIVSTLRDMPYPPAPIKVMTSKNDQEILLWCLMVSERVWHYIETRAGASRTVADSWRQAVAMATRREMQTNHPLFRGDAVMWNGLLIKKMPRAIRFNAGSTVKTTNHKTGAVVNSVVPANITVDRSLILGGQGLAIARGDMAGPRLGAFPMRWTEVLRDHQNSIEIGGGQMEGKKKLRFKGTDDSVTDFGIAVIDSYAPDPQSSDGQELRTRLKNP